MTAIAPEASKAATITGDGDLAFFSIPIEKREETEEVNPVDGTPDIIVTGKATDGSLDSDLQIVDPAWSEKALRNWLEQGPALRVMHQAKRDPAGTGLSVQGHNIRALVTEPVAKHLVRTGTLRDFSIGISNPDIRVGDPRFQHLPGWQKAINGVITGRPDDLSEISEVSLCDRGSNYGTKFAMVRKSADGSPEWVGKMYGPEDLLAKAAAPAVTKTKGTVTVELPKNMSLSVSPSDLAKLATLRQKLAREQGANKAAAPSVTKTAAPDTLAEYRAVQAGLDVLAAFKAVGDAEDAILGKGARTFTAEQRHGYAGDEIALPDGSYPMPDADAVRRAAILIRSKHGNWEGRGPAAGQAREGAGHPEPAQEEAGRLRRPPRPTPRSAPALAG